MVKLGRVRPRHRGEYSSSIPYEFYDVLEYKGSSYIVVNSAGAPIGALSTDETYYQLYAAKGDKGETGDKGDKGDTGEKGNPTTVDSSLSTSSNNPVQNKAIASKFSTIDSQIAALNTKAASLESNKLDITGKAIDSEKLNGQPASYYRCTGCSWSCGSGCTGSCMTSCTGTCSTICLGSCSGCGGRD